MDSSTGGNDMTKAQLEAELEKTKRELEVLKAAHQDLKASQERLTQALIHIAA
jgi:septal ring factor EnvC (AmiA/AmiB activator)